VDKPLIGCIVPDSRSRDATLLDVGAISVSYKEGLEFIREHLLIELRKIAAKLRRNHYRIDYEQAL
jgi:hypothetical protein